MGAGRTKENGEPEQHDGPFGDKMGKYSKLREQILSGARDGNIAFSELCTLLKRLGFDERTRGSHHIFTRQDIPEILNLQP